MNAPETTATRLREPSAGAGSYPQRAGCGVTSRSGFALTSRRAAVMKAVEGYRFNARRLRRFGALEAWYLHTYPGRDNPVYQFDPKTKAARGAPLQEGSEGRVMVRVKFEEDVSRLHIVPGSTGNVAIYSHHMHTAIETSGFLGVRATEYLQQLDLVIIDIKSDDSETYHRTTKRDLEPTVRFAERLAAMHKPVWVRFTLVPGLTDDPANVEAVAKFVAPMKNVEWVEVLPFHQFGAFKWKSPQFRDAGCNAR